jgi:hypothetical protein
MPRDFTVKDSGERQGFETGAVRDTDDDKCQWHLVPLKVIERIGMVYTRGAKKYDAHNWKRGIPSSRCWDSAVRHIVAYEAGDREEDHLAMACWNLIAIMWNEEHLPEMHDLPAAFMPADADDDDEPEEKTVYLNSRGLCSCGATFGEAPMPSCKNRDEHYEIRPLEDPPTELMKTVPRTDPD